MEEKGHILKIRINQSQYLRRVGGITNGLRGSESGLDGLGIFLLGTNKGNTALESGER